MKHVVQELTSIVTDFDRKLNGIPDDDFCAKPNPLKWSKKEILGHLIDSASNNHRRFVCGQYESTPPHIIYDQDFWVKSNDYSNAPGKALITLWVLLNRQIERVLASMPEAHYARTCNTGKQSPQLHSLQWLAEDYLKHMKHHLNQIIPGSFNISYP